MSIADVKATLRTLALVVGVVVVASGLAALLWSQLGDQTFVGGLGWCLVVAAVVLAVGGGSMPDLAETNVEWLRAGIPARLKQESRDVGALTPLGVALFAGVPLAVVGIVLLTSSGS